MRISETTLNSSPASLKLDTIKYIYFHDLVAVQHLHSLMENFQWAPEHLNIALESRNLFLIFAAVHACFPCSVSCSVSVAHADCSTLTCC